MRRCLLGLCACALLLLPVTSVQAQNLSAAMKTVFGSQFRNYQWLDYPTDNYGVGTAYRDKRTTTDPRKFLCATFTCLNINPTPAMGDDWLELRRQGMQFANKGCGGTLDAALKKQSKTALNALLPLLLNAVGIGAEFSRERDSNATLTVASACDRRLLPGPYNKYIADLKDDPFELRTAQQNSELVVVRGDIVITSFVVTLGKNSKLHAKLDAELKGKAEKLAGEKAKVSAEVTRNSEGQIVIKSTSPLIVGLIAVRQPARLGVGPTSAVMASWNGWSPIPIVLPQQ